MPTMQELITKRNEILTKVRTKREALKTEPGSWTAEDRTEVDNLNTEFKTASEAVHNAKKDVDRLKSMDDLLINQPGDLELETSRVTDPSSHSGSKSKPGRKFLEWQSKTNPKKRKLLIPGSEVLDENYNSKFVSYLRGQPQNLLRADDDETGGYFVTPAQFWGGILQTLDDPTYVQGLSTVFNISARELHVRKRTAKARCVGKGAEIRDVTDNTESSLKFGKRILTPYYVSGASFISRDLQRSAEIDIDGYLQQEIMRDNREYLEQEYLTGNGNEGPIGLFTASAEGIPTSRDKETAASLAVSFDDFLSAKYMLKAPYRRTSRYMMHRNTIAVVAALKDGNNRYLLQPTVSADEPDRINGIPVLESEWIPSTVVGGGYFAILGDFSYYWITFNMAMEIQRINEKYADINQVAYYYRYKVDAMPMLDEAFVRLKYKA